MKIVKFVKITAFALFAGCASASGAFPRDDVARPASDAPDRFATDAGAPAAASSTAACQSPITDPRSGVKLRFVRTQPGRGDYEVAVGQYGARAGELLRVDCGTLRAIGLVPR